MDNSNSKQISKLSDTKYNQFQTDLINGNYIEKKLNHFFKSEFEEIFSEILLLSKQQFITQIKNGVSLSLEDIYSEKCLNNEKLINMLENSLQSIQKDYTNIFNYLSKSWSFHEKLSKRRGNSNSEEILKIFRKHCIDTEEPAYHNCENKNNYFITINDEENTNKIKYVICTQCKKVYYSSFILCKCHKCNVDYYTNILNNIDEMNLLPATWDNYHCPQIINEKMKCIKCKDVFYLNMKTGMLSCQNKKCGFISKPSRILWTCTVCKKDFKSGCLPYNPLDLIIIKRVIKQTLLLKHLAHPNKMPCCKLNVFFTNFYHKNSCRGILYVGELNNSLIIVCDKCHAINFYDRFIWTCPECGKRFRDKIKTLPNFNNRSNSNSIHSENKNENINEENEKKSSIKNILTNRRIINSIHDNNTIDINDNNNINVNTNIVINDDSPKRRKLKKIKENNNNSSGYFNFGNVNNILNKVDENSQTIENNKVQNNNEIKRERTNYFQKYREKKEKERKEKEKEKEEKEKEKKEKEEKEKEEKEKEEKEEKMNNDITDRKRIREKRNIIRNDIYHRKQIEEIKKPKHKYTYNLTEENIIAKNENIKKLVNEGEKRKNETKIINNVDDKLINNNNNNNSNNNNNIILNYKKNSKHHNLNLNNHENFEEEIEGDDEEEIEEEEIENHNKYRYNNDKKGENAIKQNKRRRRPEGRKTKGQEIKEETPEISQEIKKIKESDKNDKNVPMSNIAGISEHLLNYINKRMNFILSRSKIPIINIEEYILYKKLGEGSYGVIYSVFKQNEKKLYALKKIIAHTLNEIDEFTKEFELVHSCEHQNIMKIYGICLRVLDSTTYALYVLMEYSNGDWDKEIRIHLAHRKNYTEIELISILYQLTTALLFMQEKLKVSHRDIKPQNILTFNNGVYKLADFGEAKEVKISKQLNTLRGTELYMSPALYDGLKNEKDDVSHNPFKSDVFSLGFCFLYAAALNFNLLYEIRDINDSKIINIILHKHLKKNYSEKFIFILYKMLEIDENKRYDFPSLIKEINTYYNINNI